MRKSIKIRSGECYLREAKHLRKIKETLDLNYELDQKISELLRQRRADLRGEITIAQEYEERSKNIRLIK